MTTFIINPGTGPCRNARWTVAKAQVHKLLREALGSEAYRLRVEYVGSDGDGRYTFTAGDGRHSVQISMPGVPCSYEGRDLPPGPVPLRLYVDGSSWFWYLAVDAVKEVFDG